MIKNTYEARLKDFVSKMIDEILARKKISVDGILYGTKTQEETANEIRREYKKYEEKLVTKLIPKTNRFLERMIEEKIISTRIENVKDNDDINKIKKDMEKLLNNAHPLKKKVGRKASPVVSRNCKKMV